MTVVALVATRVGSPGDNRRPATSAQTGAVAPQNAPPPEAVQQERLSKGPTGNAVWVHEALSDIHRACEGARKAESAQEEVESQGSYGGAFGRGLEGALNEDIYGGFVKEDVNTLIHIYRTHPDALYGRKPMKRVMLDAAADLGNGSCDGSESDRIAREVELDG